ncbi:TauD/TfdA family dioxygenase [Acinetobacter shaoyimingii]|uniref:TauD/TfdA family dioxygenase n=1 Tax=Acinetobacter shaoyimingii TaxID=2715164 RepID=A0A6G8RZQ9_9GAMM|nr:TauD/TfdA family dioxygenase [Acinetobacter shaoyimingii]QIO07361.1 TauD/TfdA family dioxygenase [Acinetobacter shaoyimingii]
MQLKNQNINDFTQLFLANPNQNSYQELSEYIRNNRQQILKQLHEYGILIFRGFKIENKDNFQKIVENDLGFSPWNAFNPNLPGFIASWIRKYSENLLGAGDYRRYLGRNTVQLGPVENSVQGPHVEGGIRSERSRYIALFCQEPSHYLAETGFNNLEKVWRSFPHHLKDKYLHAWNHFYYLSGRKVNIFDKVLLKKSPFQIDVLPNKRAKLTLSPSPLVVIHPETQQQVIQPWAFAHNTNPYVYKAAQKSFADRGNIEIDSTADGMQLNWEIFNANGKSIEWTDTEKQEFFDAMYKDALLLEWEKGDFALVDNIKIAHWRMNGEQGNRKLIQIQANSFDANKYAVG